jgi:hypothetical protein
VPKRQEAEAKLMSLRVSPNALEICRYILETSNLSLAQFHAAIALREVILREWRLYSRETRNELQEYLIEWLNRRISG